MFYVGHVLGKRTFGTTGTIVLVVSVEVGTFLEPLLYKLYAYHLVPITFY